MRKTALVLVLMMFLCAPMAMAQSKLAMDEVGEALGFLGKNFSGNLGPSQVLGKPLQVGEVTIIPVVVKCLGFGMGAKLESLDEAKKSPKAGKDTSREKNRIGLGGGGMTRPIALLMIYPDGKYQVIDLHKNALAQMVGPFVPVLKDFLGKMFYLRKLQIELHQAQSEKEKTGFKKK